jgi:hypothetical protein
MVAWSSDGRGGFWVALVLCCFFITIYLQVFASFRAIYSRKYRLASNT